MKKNHYDREEDNIILFPGLKHRLYEKGIERMEANDFQEAANMLRQAKALDPSNDEVCTAFLVALYESSAYEEAKLIASELLHEGIGDYYEITDIYLMILIQLNQHDQVVHTLEMLFEEKEVPKEKMEHFQTILGLSKKVLANDEQAKSISIDYDYFNSLDLQEQTFQLGSLADKNIHPYLDSLVLMLEDKQAHPFLQTIILNVLRENKISQEVFVRKMHYKGTFIPAELSEVGETSLFQTISNALEVKLEHDNPILFMQLDDMIKRHAFILYPFEFEKDNANLWTLAYRGLGYEMYGDNWNTEKLASEFNVRLEDLKDAMMLLTELEQISSPII
ncbi:tetratricopeptide repeat protein [Bacillus sp. FSL K6-3431]|uniref:tetratricopeptide repeat protein n=1 Tax=Bacillus sp. FSL K6-3431 TaxID=2921500 RepID=UPI0030FC5F03